MYYSTVTSKGQTTIPSEIREIMSLTPGDRLEFISNGKYITIIPINKSLTTLKGILPKPDIILSCEEMDKIIKG